MLNVQAEMRKYEQVHTLTRMPCMFMHLRHLSCEIKIFNQDPNSHNEILQVARYLEFAPKLEMLQLDMFYSRLGCCWRGEMTEEAGSLMRCHDHLKTVYMSGLRCYRYQLELLCCILEKAAVLEDVSLEPNIKMFDSRMVNFDISANQIRKCAQRIAQRFCKEITIL